MYTTEQVAQKLEVTPGRIRQLIGEGVIRPWRSGGYAISEAELKILRKHMKRGRGKKLARAK